MSLLPVWAGGMLECPPRVSTLMSTVTVPFSAIPRAATVEPKASVIPVNPSSTMKANESGPYRSSSSAAILAEPLEPPICVIPVSHQGSMRLTGLTSSSKPLATRIVLSGLNSSVTSLSKAPRIPIS